MSYNSNKYEANKNWFAWNKGFINKSMNNLKINNLDNNVCAERCFVALNLSF